MYSSSCLSGCIHSANLRHANILKVKYINRFVDQNLWQTPYDLHQVSKNMTVILILLQYSVVELVANFQTINTTRQNKRLKAKQK